jgi:F-type H+-transporting ATPase subunit delta
VRNPRAGRRYAQALFEIALGQGTVREVYRELAAAAAQLDASPDLRRLLDLPFVSRDHKWAAVEAVFRADWGETVRGFLRLLVAKDRCGILDDVVEEFRRMWHAHEGLHIADVTTAAPIADAELTALTAALQTQVGGHVESRVSVDPALIGGAVVVVGDQVWDGSIRGALERMRRELKAQDVVGALRKSRGS